MKEFIENEFNRETEDSVYFYTPKFYALDNFSAYMVEIWGKKFPTVEHAYQWRKFNEANPDIAEAIFNATSPNAVKEISDANRDKVQSNFKDFNLQIMEDILRAKTEQHTKVKQVLKATSTKTIIENSPTDNFWGIGDGKGQNTLGKIWMKIREDL